MDDSSNELEPELEPDDADTSPITPLGSAGAVDRPTPPETPRHVRSTDEVTRVPPWGAFAITLLLVVMAAGALVRTQNEGLAGVVIGYVAAYWLPVRQRRGE